MSKNIKSGKYALIALFTLFLCIFLIVSVPFIIFPMYLENAPKDAISVLNVYKNSINLVYGALVIYIIAVIVAFGLFFKNASVEKVVKPRLVRSMFAVVIVWTGLMFVMLNDMGVFEEYDTINAALEQYTNGDFEYVEARVYKEDENSVLHKTRLVDVFYQMDGSDAVLDNVTTWVLDDQNATINEYTYYVLPEDVEFDYSEVPVSISTGGSIRTSEVDAYREKYEAADNVYKIGYTRDLNIISSIEKVEK